MPVEPTKTRTVVIRMLGGDFEGKWLVVPDFDTAKYSLQHTNYNNTTIDSLQPTTVILVETGKLEWEGNQCAEVLVPKDKLEYYLSEFPNDEEN